jgi:hypothetical protein
MRRRDISLNEDDDYEYEPIKRKSSNRTLFIVLGVAGGVLLILVVGCAGLAYWGFRNFAGFPDLTTGADRFLNDLKNRRVVAAYERTTKQFQSRQTLAQFHAQVQQHPALTTHTSRTYTGFNVFSGPGGSRGTVNVTLKGPEERLAFTLVLSDEDGLWKVTQLNMP